MPFTLTMPKLSPTMESGTIVKWHKNVGDYVNVGETIFEIATDKATVEHEMLDAGWLRQILLPEGNEAVVNAPLAIFTEEKEELIEGYVPEGEVAPPQTTTPAAPQSIAETVTAKIPPSAPAEPGHPMQPSAAAIKAPTQPAPSSTSTAATAGGRIMASPLAKRLAQEQGLDLRGVKGSGPSGRIMKRDLEHARPSTGASKILPQLPAGTFEEIALTPMRKVIAQRLQEAKSTIPHFYVRQTVDAEALILLREQLKNFEVNVTFNDLVIKAIALALRVHPEVNSGFNAAKNILLRYKTIDISVAVSIEGGLITPIITHADYKSVLEISAEVKELAKRAKEGKLLPHEYQGGSFTLSNMGMYGVSDFQAIINPPQAAILAVSGISDSPVVKNGSVIPGKLLNITLSVDHRAIDGAVASKFIKSVQQHLENPAILLVSFSN